MTFIKQAKRKLIEVMQQEKGIYFTLGWLESAYINYDRHDIEEEIVVNELMMYGINVEIEAV